MTDTASIFVPKADMSVVLLPNTKNFIAHLAKTIETPTPILITATGPAGIGKTTALKHFVDHELSQGEGCHLPASVFINVRVQTAPRQLLASITRKLDEKLPGKNLDEQVENVSQLLNRNKVSWLMVDDAHHLSRRCLAILVNLYKSSVRSTILTGLPGLNDRLNTVEELRGIKVVELNFAPPAADDVVREFLPGLAISRTIVNSDSKIDLIQQIWNSSQHNLYRFSNILRIADAIASRRNAEVIDMDVVNETFNLMGFPNPHIRRP